MRKKEEQEQEVEVTEEDASLGSQNVSFTRVA